MNFSDDTGDFRQAKIALVNMPFARTSVPSIQCGILKAELERVGHVAKVHYLNMELASEIGGPNYDAIAEFKQANLLLGEWVFSAAAFGYCADEEEYLAKFPVLGRSKIDLEWLFKLRRDLLPVFVKRWATRIDWAAYDAVGFTSTFVQNNAAFALSRVLKEKYPRLITIFGGSNFHGCMGREFLSKLPFMDYVVDGEGEGAILGMADRLARGQSCAGIPGVLFRKEDGSIDGSPAKKVERMDILAEPDYDEYFETLWRLGKQKVLGASEPILLFETARGCWWGEKHHCTFCGLNGSDLGFKAKTPERVLQELKGLSDRYQVLLLASVDNIIDMKYIDKVCKPLIQARGDQNFFWEVKSNMTPRQLKTMASAGILHVQPGIESLDTHVLKLMRKGVTMLKNLRFLKWASYFHLNISWNILTGFPGETAEDYAKQLRIIPLCKHLPPPGVWGRLWLERFSPYFFDPSFPVQSREPGSAYRFAYPQSDLDLNEVAYFFEHEMGNTLPDEHHQELFGLLKKWKESWEKAPRPVLAYRRGAGWIQIVDQREETTRNHWLYEFDSLVYESCVETDRSAEAVARQVREIFGSGDLIEVTASLNKFCEMGIMLEEDGHYLSLAQPLNRHWLTDDVVAAQPERVVRLNILEPAVRA